MQSLSRCVLATLLYSDVFGYPLTIDEIRKRLLFLELPETNWQKKLEHVLGNLPGISEKNGYYYTYRHSQSVEERMRRAQYSFKKIQRAKKFAEVLKWIPTIELVALTGAVAVEYGKKDDDIDFLIITKSECLWITRFFVTVLFDLLRVRRQPQDSMYNNKFCLNMFLDCRHLALVKKEHDVYSAYELMQMKVLWERDTAFQKFLRANFWIKKLLPNAWVLAYQNDHHQKSKTMLFSKIIQPLEYLFREIQLLYMKKRRTQETIEKGVIRFHPQDVRKRVLKSFSKKCHARGIDVSYVYSL